MITSFVAPFRLVSGYFIVGFLFLVLSIFSYFLADFNAITALPTAGFLHIFLVGFVVSIIIGALYQLTSVILEKEFYITKFAMINLVIYAFGVFVFAFGLLKQSVGMMHGGGTILFVSLVYFCTTYLLSFKSSMVRNFAYYALFIAGIFLLIGILLGYALLFVLVGALNLDFMLLLNYHIYFVLGFIYFILLGSTSVLMPMFSLCGNVSFRLYFISAGLYVCGGAVLGAEYRVSIIWICLSLVGFVAQVGLMLKKRQRKAWDYWNLNIVASMIFLLLSILLFILKNEAWIICVIFGFLYAFIVGHIYKILQFLVWYHYISPFVGKAKVPLLEDMVMKNIALFSLIFNVLGVIFAIIGCSFLAILFMGVSVILFMINVINILKFSKFGVSGDR
ncbi:hypothetical protein [Campylobacter corcagiensis]|uniref:Peptidase M50 n=1 Tax=Campylobacter corcagiensis TaxID=1448857 RepID=A0A7M1LFW0_9BACT|nr:hypothetical protein [Campylobacter corcagiensis]QKF65064.1 putative membrane protein [Campylobacter corcagiensis]QOQ86786.1 peptidase M50 [Campylobacter corcagiensis]